VEITRYVKGSGLIGGCDGANVTPTAGLVLLAGLLARRRRKA
jgi:uncharacterized protein (TIGR03382 family)